MMVTISRGPAVSCIAAMHGPSISTFSATGSDYSRDIYATFPLSYHVQEQQHGSAET